MGDKPRPTRRASGKNQKKNKGDLTLAQRTQPPGGRKRKTQDDARKKGKKKAPSE